MIFNTSSSKNLAAAVELLGEDDLLQQLLVPVDFSDCSDNAIRFAVAIALRTGARIKLFHSVHLPLPSTEIVDYPIDELEREAARQLGDKVVEITTWLEKERLRKLDVQHQVRIGFAAEEVVRTASEDGTDLIVMGTHGAGWLGGALLGSNATMVLQRVSCPVLAVPAAAEFAGFNKIVYASDMREVNRPAIQMLVDFAKNFDANVYVLHVMGHGDAVGQEEAAAFRDQFGKAAHYPKVEFHMVDAGGKSLIQAVEQFVEAEKIDAVAMLTHQRGVLGKLIHPSQTKRFALHGHKPLLAFH
jgi:nucleotide-binding universal stress UspA family protein